MSKKINPQAAWPFPSGWRADYCQRSARGDATVQIRNRQGVSRRFERDTLNGYWMELDHHGNRQSAPLTWVEMCDKAEAMARERGVTALNDVAI